ncbi:hypothetical protein L226DRAFT_538614 [Lentinus tigrinus ALCF2SS1-7]|uniref:uncharacterized protein n=1 Tax=Lentinus tigrinus ALCF2SS1-7 TaxID=1328758 RepID=UPI0011663DA3|nr:hypothetical protein L226DRAFT_538614 [Lentinus tigrinus ALCF2SS1-7]
MNPEAQAPSPPQTKFSRPDSLVFFLHANDEDGTIDGRYPKVNKLDKRLKHYAPVLDSLARLLVNQPGKQVYAVAIVPPSLEEPNALVLVGEDAQRVPKDVVSHLEYLLKAVCAAGATVRKSPPLSQIIPTYIPENTEYPLLKQLLAMEVAVYRHSWVKRRSEKYGWSKAFLDVCAAIQLPSPPQSIPLEAFAILQELQGPEGDRDSILLAFRTASSALTDMLDALNGDCDDANIHRLRLAMEGLDVSVNSLRRLLPGVLEKCRSYIRLVQRNLNQKLDFERWIQKLLSTRRDFGQLLALVRSPTLDHVLGAGFEIKVITPAPVPPVLWEVSMDSLQWALGADITITVEEQDMRKFVDQVVGKVGCAVMKSDYIHCECAILVELLKISRTRRIIPYVGVSKLSCALCHAYFAAYGEATKSNISTQGTHGQMVGWRCPTLEHDLALDKRVRGVLTVALSQSLGRAVSGVTAPRRRSVSSQSTTASSDPPHVPQRMRTLQEYIGLYEGEASSS